MKSIYLDQAATTYPKCEEVYEIMDKVNRNIAVNAGRGSYASAREATEIIDATRKMLLSLVNGTQVAEVVLTASATIALNEIIGGIDWKEGDVVYVSPFEHNSVARPLNFMKKKYKIDIQELPLLKDSMEIDVKQCDYLFEKNKPKAIFMTHISNVTGYILPVQEIFEIAKEHNSLTILDASQSLGLLPIDLTNLKADIVAFAGHKNLYGPFGCGGFFLKDTVELSEYITGGTGSNSLELEMPQNHPNKFEASSPNIVALAGLKAALETRDENMFSHELELTQYLTQKLQKMSHVILYLPPEEKHIGIVAFNLIDYSSAEVVGTILDADYDIALRTGYHCAPYIHKHLKDKKYSGVVRASLGRFTTKEEIDELLRAVEELEE